MLTSIARRPGTLFYVPGIETIPTTHPDVVSQQEDEQEEPVIFVKREAMKRNVDDGRTDEQKQDTSKRDNIRARESAQKSPGKQPEAQTGVIDEKRRIDSANVDAFQGSPRDQDQRDEVVPEDSTKLTADQLERLRLSIDIHDLYKYKDHRRQAKCDDSSNIFKKHRRPANCDEDTEEGTRLMIEDLERLRMSNDIHDLYKFKNNHRPANCSIQEDNLGSGGDELGANVAGNQAHEKVIRGHQPVQRDDNSKTDELGRGVNSKRRRIYAAKVDAKLWNDKFPYDKIADNQRDRNETEKVVVFGIETSLHLRIPERVKTITQHLPYVRDGLGHCDEGGHFVETTGASLVRVAKAVDRAIFHGDVRNRCLVSLDAGSGNGYPSMVFSQLFDKGFHIGAELCPGLVANSMSNLKALTAKGVVNLMDGKLDKEQVEQFGELAHNVPPRAFFVHGNLEAIEHLGGFDFVYGFDAVNSWETKLAKADTEESTSPSVEELERLRLSIDIDDLIKYKNHRRQANCSIQEDNLGPSQPVQGGDIEAIEQDTGSGNGYTSMVFDQLFDKGFHVGAELCPGLVANSMDQRDEVVPEDSTKLTADQLERLRMSTDIDQLYKYKDHRRRQ